MREMSSAGSVALRGPGHSPSSSFQRSSVHILLSDKDSDSRQDVLELLRRCSYKVTPVENARQALEVLQSNGPSVDLILAEVELPNGKGYKMLKHIMKEERLKQIPVVMMSSRDEMAVVVKCLRLGAADYLVKPLRTNELLNLWTHMWRRRREIGLSDRNRMNGLNINDPPLDSFLQDPSESNTNSTDLFSDDTDDRKKSEPATSVLEVGSGDDGKDEIPRSPVLELSLKLSADASHVRASLDVERKAPDDWKKSPEKSEKLLGVRSPLKNNELRIGQSSAFVNFGDSIQWRERISSPANGLRIGKEGENMQIVGAAALNVSPHHLQHLGSPLRVSDREEGTTKGLGSPLQSSRLKHRSELVNGHLSLSTPLTDVRLPFATPLPEYVTRGWDGHLSASGTSLMHKPSSGVTTASTMEGHDGFGREPVREGYTREGFACDVSGRENYVGNLYGRDLGSRDNMPFQEGGLRQDGGCDTFPVRDVSQERQFSDQTREPFVREGFRRDIFGRESPRWNSRGLPVEPVRSTFPPNHQFTLMKLRIPPDAHPEMGAMLPPSLPHQIPHPHLSASMSHLPPGLPNMGIPPSLHPGALVQSAISPIYHAHVMTAEAPLSIPPPGILPHALAAGHGHPAAHFSFYPPTLGRPAHLPPPLLLAPPAPPWPAIQVPVSERKLELAERREAALNKFRQKRKDRCFEKKIRYVSRKRLAEQRPRNRGQFVKQNNGGAKEGEEEDEDEEEDEEYEEGEGQMNEESSPDEEELSSGDTGQASRRS